MKKLLLTAAIAASIAGIASAEVKVKVTPLGEKPVRTENTIQKSTSFAAVLANEDFSLFSHGTEAEPDYDNPVVGTTFGAINPDLTHGSQWYGQDVYEAGGSVCLRTLNTYYPAYLYTPRADYSGNVKVTFLAKYIKFYFDDGSGNQYYWPGSSLSVSLATPDGDRFTTDADGYDPSNVGYVRLYDKEGWCEVEVEFTNESAYDDTSVVFATGEGMLIDDVKVTCSYEGYIAVPARQEIFDVTETSFSVKFDPVRHAFNYYTYLYTMEGVDEDGKPIYMPVFSPEMMAELEDYGMTVEEYIEMGFDGNRFDPYLNYGTVEEFKPTVFTYTDLDPETDYYAIRSHYISDFSELDIRPVNVIANPTALDATDVKKDQFTANWTPIVKADSYDVALYGVNILDADEENFTVFDEYFDKTSEYTDNTDIYAPTELGPENGITSIDDFTTYPGWESNMQYFPVVDGMLGIGSYYSSITTPEIDVENSDMMTLSLRVKSTVETGAFTVRIISDELKTPITYTAPYDNGVFENDVITPTEGLKNLRIQISGDQTGIIFIDHIAVTQSLKKGDVVYLYLGETNVDKDVNSYTFNDLTDENFGYYAFAVQAVRGEGESRIESVESDRIIVDLTKGDSWNGIEDVATPAAGAIEVARYTIDGRLISEPQKGINVVKYSDGSVRKVIVK